MENSSSRSGSQSFVLVLCLLVSIYFLFPHLYLLPYVLVTGSQPPASPPFTMLFVPVRFLSEKIPAYQALLEAESKLTGVH